jgi:mRNA interferase MazF
MPNSGDVVRLDLGQPEGREAGFSHPAVVVTAQRILDAEPSVIHVVPFTSTDRGFHSEVLVAPDEHNGLEVVSAVQCQHIRAVSRQRIVSVLGNVGPVVLRQLRESVAVILDLP